MKDFKTYRINGFEQIKAFYSWVFNNPDKVRPTHISLYLFLINQANRANWAEWFKCPYDLAMQGACIGNNGTYYKCLDDLHNWGLIKYTKGINNYKAPLINLICLYDNVQLTEQVTVPLSEQVTAQQTVQLTEQLPVHIYKLLTDNIKLITDNLPEVVDFLNKGKEEINYNGIIENFHLYCDRMSKVSKLSDLRKKHISARIKDFDFDTVISVIEKAGKSDFLCGVNDKTWKADIDWIFNPTNFLKIMEGKYDNKVKNEVPKAAKTGDDIMRDTEGWGKRIVEPDPIYRND